MPTDRQEKVNSVIKKTLGDILLKEIDFKKDIFVTIMRVDSSPSLEYADVYLSVFPDKKTNEVLQVLQKNIYHLQKILNKRIVLKFVPKIVFKVDEGFRQENEMNKIFDSIND